MWLPLQKGEKSKCGNLIKTKKRPAQSVQVVSFGTVELSRLNTNKISKNETSMKKLSQKEKDAIIFKYQEGESTYILAKR